MLLERRSAPDPSFIVGLSPAMRTLSADAVSAVAAAMQYVELGPGESLFPEDDRIDALYVVQSGVLHATEPDATGAPCLVRTIGVGEAIDQLQVLSGGSRRVEVRAIEPCQLWTIPGDVAAQSWRGGPEMLDEMRARSHNGAP